MMKQIYSRKYVVIVQKKIKKTVTVAQITIITRKDHLQ
jgi:hypothetical protein